MVCERVSDKLQHVQAKKVIKSAPGNRLISVRLLLALKRCYISLFGHGLVSA